MLVKWQTLFSSWSWLPWILIHCGWDARLVNSFYFPERQKNTFRQGDELNIKVDTVTSYRTQLPLDYYSLPFCRPPEGIQQVATNWGQILQGNRVQNSPYNVSVHQDVYCQVACLVQLDNNHDDDNNNEQTIPPNNQHQHYNKRNTTMDYAIRNNYHHNWILDNLPAASKSENDVYVVTQYWQGFPIGYVDLKSNKTFINNHVNIEIMIHPVRYNRRHNDDEPEYRVVRFTVEPFSIQHDDYDATTGQFSNPIPSCDRRVGSHRHTSYEMLANTQPQEAAAATRTVVVFTYDVMWIENLDLRWSQRWDIYLSMDHAIPGMVHWYSIVNSAGLVVWISIIALVMWRWMLRDITQYRLEAVARRNGSDAATATRPVEETRLDSDSRIDRLICVAFCGLLAPFWMLCNCLVRLDTEATTQNTNNQVRGWKAGQNHVFRPPVVSPLMLAVACGTGAQLLATCLLTIVFSAVGLLSWAYRGYLTMTMLVLFVLMGMVCGYVAAIFYKSFHGQNWQLVASAAALTFPGTVFGVIAIMHAVSAIDQKSQYAMPLQSWVLLVAAWLCVEAPLVCSGIYLGYKRGHIAFPVKPTGSPRAIPGHKWVHNLVIIPLSLLGCGIFPFGAIFVELYYLLASAWMHYYYFAYGYLLLVFLITAITGSVVSILMTYFQLRLEDYRWWWRSFNNAGAMAMYVFLYSTVYYRQLEATTWEARVLYFGYMTLVCLSLFLMMGFTGVCASLWFTKLVYATERDDDEEVDQPLVDGSDVELPSIS